MDQQTISTYCTVVNKNDNSKYICYFHTKKGLFNICITNGSEVWRTDFTEDKLAQHIKEFSLKSTEGYVSKIRLACGNCSASVLVQEDEAVLQLGETQGAASVALARLGDPEGREELRDLLFQMADELTRPGSRASFSPMRNQPRGNAEYEPRRQQGGNVLAVKKRLPGDCLINPGSRRKKAATGVAFDENDDP